MRVLATILLTLFAGSSAHAATNDTIVLSGSVASTLAVDCTDTAGATSLDFDGGTAVTIVKVSDCSGTTNDDAGLTVTFNPDAAFTSAGSDTIPFSVESVADAASAPVAGDFPGDDVDETWATAASGATDADVYIKFTQDPTLDPGTYAATIAVTSTDNS